MNCRRLQSPSARTSKKARHKNKLGKLYLFYNLHQICYIPRIKSLVPLDIFCRIISSDPVVLRSNDLTINLSQFLFFLKSVFHLVKVSDTFAGNKTILSSQAYIRLPSFYRIFLEKYLLLNILK